MAGIAILLSELAEFGGKVSEYRKQLPQYFIRKTKIDLTEGTRPDAIFEHLKKKFSANQQNFEDGLRIDFEDTWVNFRKSNTEPIVRIIAEAKTAKGAEALLDAVRNEITGL
jgi:phosphomannomutase